MRRINVGLYYQVLIFFLNDSVITVNLPIYYNLTIIDAVVTFHRVDNNDDNPSRTQ